MSVATTHINGSFHLVQSFRKVGGIEFGIGREPDGHSTLIKRVAVSDIDQLQRQRIGLVVEALKSAVDGEAGVPLWAGEEDGYFYLVRPLISGLSLRDRLADGHLSLKEVIRFATALMQSLDTIHKHGIHHLGVCPSNIVLSQADGGQIKYTLVDYASARLHPAYDNPQRDINDVDAIERVHYLSPEASGLIQHEVAEGADLYAAGIVLYQCLTGATPFEGKSIGEILGKQATVTPKRLHTVDRNIPRSLSDVVMHLLAKDPRDRYQSASGVLADLAVIAISIDSGVEPDLIVGAQDRRAVLADSVFIGRETEKANLDNVLKKTALGQGGLVYVEGESGCGKSRLLEEWLDAIGPHFRVLRGQALDQSVQRPFEVLTGVAKGVATSASVEPIWINSIRKKLDKQQPVVGATFAELTDVFDSVEDETGLGPESLGELRGLRALSTFFDALGDDDRPAVIVLDDCQWADDMTIKLLGHWQRRPELDAPAPRHVSVVAAFRKEEVAEDSPLRRIEPSEHLTVTPLRTNELRALAESMAGPLPDAAIQTIEQLSDGNPFMASAVLRGLVEAGALIPSSSGWSVDANELNNVQSSSQSAAFLVHRLSALPQDALRLLRIAAVLGKEFELDLAASVSGVSRANALKLLTDARHRCMVWTKEAGVSWCFVHDKIREALLKMTNADERRQVHLDAAEQIEKIDRSRSFALAFHFDAAGEHLRALPHALEAGKISRSRHALESAESQFRIAARGMGDNRDVRLEISLALGDILTLRGRYEEAGYWYEVARPLVSGRQSQAKLESRIGELAFKRMDYMSAFDACTRGLRALGRRTPKHTAVFIPLFIWEVFKQVAHRRFPNLIKRNSKPERAADDALAASLLDRLTYLWFFARAGKIPAGWGALRAVNIAERHPPTVELGYAYTILGAVTGVAFPPFVRLSYGLHEKALATHIGLSNLHGQGQNYVYRWPSFLVDHDYETALDMANQGSKLLAITGDQWDINAAYWGGTLTTLQMGDLVESTRWSQRMYQAAREINDTQHVANAIWLGSQADPRGVPIESVNSMLAKSDLFVATRASLLAAKGVWLLRSERRPEEALKFLDEASRMMLKSNLFDIFTERMLAWRTTAAREAALASSDLALQEKRLAQAAKFAFAARMSGRFFRLSKAHGLRESGLIAALQGKKHRARRYLDASVQSATKDQLPHELIEALVARANVGELFGWSSHQLDQAAADHMKSTFGQTAMLDHEKQKSTMGGGNSAVALPKSIALADRFVSVIEHGRLISSSLNRQTIYANVEGAARSLLSGDRCQVLTYANGVQGDIQIAEAQWINEALKTNAPRRLLTDSNSDLDNVLAGLVKSALVAPIKVRGDIVACLYVSSHSLSELFGTTEESLAAFITVLAGAALENAEGVTELERVHRELEANSDAALRKTVDELRVAERIASDATLAKSEFLANISHEIRTPMNAIVGMARVLADTNLDDTQREFVNVVLSGSEHLLTIISDVLDFSKIESGKLELESSPFSIRECVADTVRLMEQAAKDKKISLNYEIESGTPEGVVADRSRVRQVLLNLVGNAIKFTDEGEIVIKVKSEGFKKGQHVTHFAVSDTGIGISADKIGALFEPFRQGDASTTRLYGGSGLGLAICRRLVSLMGGEIWVESEKDQGSVFHFTVATSEIEMIATSMLSDQTSSEFRRPIDSSLGERLPLRILVAEDNLLNQKVMEATLARLGYEIDLVANGREAVEATREGRYDIIFMDILMPELDGIGATQIIREELSVNGPCIIALTANATGRDRDRCLKAGLNDFLTKPVTAEQLAEVIEKWGQQTSGVDLREAKSLGVNVDTGILFDSEPIKRLHQTIGRNNVLQCIELFVQQVHTTMGKIEESIAEGDVPSLERAAHSLKSSSGTLGFFGLKESARKLEEMAEMSKLDDANIQIDTIRAQCIEVLDLIEADPPVWLDNQLD